MSDTKSKNPNIQTAIAKFLQHISTFNNFTFIPNNSSIPYTLTLPGNDPFQKRSSTLLQGKALDFKIDDQSFSITLKRTNMTVCLPINGISTIPRVIGSLPLQNGSTNHEEEFETLMQEMQNSLQDYKYAKLRAFIENLKNEKAALEEKIKDNQVNDFSLI